MKTDRGLTLIELVVAMAIFALIAVMGLQALTGAMRSRDRMVQIDTNSAELGLALSLLRADLGALVPMLFHPPGGTPRSALHLDAPGRVLGLSLAGQPALPPEPGPGLRRVEWRFDPGTGTLSRAAWPALYPVPSATGAPPMPVLTDVTSWAIRSHWPELGWLPGTTGGPPRAAPESSGSDTDGGRSATPESYSSTLPQAVELTLESRRYGRIVLVESLK